MVIFKDNNHLFIYGYRKIMKKIENFKKNKTLKMRI